VYETHYSFICSSVMEAFKTSKSIQCKNSLYLLFDTIFFFTGSRTPLGPGLCFSVSWSFLEMVGLLGWAISSSQGVYLKHRTIQTQNRHIHTPNIHALCGIRTHDPSFPSEWRQFMPDCSTTVTSIWHNTWVREVNTLCTPLLFLEYRPMKYSLRMYCIQMNEI
jgi:hypothetical protein